MHYIIGVKTRNVLLGSVVGLFMLVSLALVACGKSETDYTDPNDLLQLITEQQQDYILIDVRTGAEYEAGFIPPAINTPYDALAENLPTEEESALIVVYCRSGRRSAIAKATLQELGYDNVVDFGGINRWEAELELPSPVATEAGGA